MSVTRAEQIVRRKWRLLEATLEERARRLWAGAEADAMGHGGVAAVARATKLAISTVRKGRDEVRAGARREDVVNVRRSAGK
ncbi:MAG: ISAzo13 family transposase, partial [Polyangiaceae bacterium]